MGLGETMAALHYLFPPRVICFPSESSFATADLNPLPCVGSYRTLREERRTDDGLARHQVEFCTEHLGVGALRLDQPRSPAPDAAGFPLVAALQTCNVHMDVCLGILCP